MVFAPGTSQSVAVRITSQGVGAFKNAMGGAKSSLLGVRGAALLAGGALTAIAAGGFAAAIGAARDFETAMVEVQKVTDEATAAALAPDIRDMAEVIPLASSELAGLAADAARFGIQGQDNILAFTESVAKMATATDLSTNEAGQALARLSNLTNTPVGEIENLGSAINELSNNFATSSSGIVDSMLRSSAALSQLGLNQTEIAGMSAALNEVSESSRRAGTRLRRVAQEMMNPKKVSDLAGALGMTAEEFKRQRDEAPLELILQMVEAFEQGGESADLLRRNMTTASRQALAGLAQNADGLNDALGLSEEHYKENTSLQREFAAAIETTDAQVELLKNRLRNAAIVVGNRLLPGINRLLGVVNDLLDPLLAMNERTEGMTGTMLLAGTAVAGLALILGGLSAPLLAVAGVVAFLAMAWQRNFGNIRGVTENTLGRVREIWDKHAGPLFGPGGEVRQILDSLSAFWAEWGDEIALVWNFIWDLIGGIVTTALNDVLTGVRIALNLLQGDWEEAWLLMADNLVSKLNGILTFAAKWGGKFMDALLRNLPAGLQETVRSALGLGGGEAFTLEAPQISNPFEAQLAELNAAERREATSGSGTMSVEVTGKLKEEDGEVTAHIDDRVDVKNQQTAEESRRMKDREV